eukprot:6482567-Ditylum_brightwellii.AAC.1
MVHRHLTTSIATAKGHLNQQRMNVQSTKAKERHSTAIDLSKMQHDPDYDIQVSIVTWTNGISTGIIDINQTGTGKQFLDLTG